MILAHIGGIPVEESAARLAPAPARRRPPRRGSRSRGSGVGSPAADRGGVPGRRGAPPRRGRPRRDHDAARSPQEAGANHGLVHYYFGSMENLLARVLERFTERLIERQRAMYAAPDVPFIEKWRTAMRYLDADREYQKVWCELQALAWNRPELRERVAHVDAEWRAVLTEAFAEPRERYGMDMPLDALVALVITFNEGIILERLSGIETGQAELLEWIDGWLQRRRAMTRPRRTGARADARALPGRGGLRRARRRAHLLRGLRLRRADDPAAADVVDHPLAPLEGADPLSRPPCAGRDVRRARQRPLRPAGRGRGVRRARVRRRRAGRDGRHGHRARRPRRAVAGALWGTLLAAEHPERVGGRRLHRARGAVRHAPGPHGATAFDEPLDSYEGWEKWNRFYWLENYREFLEFFFGKVFTEPHSTKQIEDCVAAGAWRRSPARSGEAPITATEAGRAARRDRASGRRGISAGPGLGRRCRAGPRWCRPGW